MRSCEVGLQTDRFTQGVRSILQLALLFVHSPEGVRRLSIVGGGRNRRMELFHRFIERALLPKRDAEGVVNVRLRRINSLRLTELSEGLQKAIIEFEG